MKTFRLLSAVLLVACFAVTLVGLAASSCQSGVMTPEQLQYKQEMNEASLAVARARDAGLPAEEVEALRERFREAAARYRRASR